MKKSYYFLIMMLLTYVVLYFIYPVQIIQAFKYVYEIMLEILPILLMIYVFLFAFSFIKEKKLNQFIQKAPKFLKYILMSLLGTFSHGPIYAWYPLLENLNQKGISNGNVASFLYARGIKLTLLPMLAAFFGLEYAIILSIVMFIFAVIQGYVIDFMHK